jgi:phosphatidylethanolamine/phosphatidyl-N-methylethanolamine N-methyltransferase
MMSIATSDKATQLARRRYNRNALFYDLHEAPLEWFVFSRWRKRLWSKVEGERVLEIGVGTGKNFAYHPESVSVTGIDFAEKMLRRARRRAERKGYVIDLRSMDAQEMEFAMGAFDSVVSSFVFCSVPDAIRGLREAHRVLRPGGKAVFLEHVRSKNRLVGPLMDLGNPVAVRLSGANINRDTVSNVEAAGFSVESVTPLFWDIVLLIEARKA